MLIDQLLAVAGMQDNIEIPEGWAQGRALFGGLVGALMIKKAQSLIHDPQKILRSAFINFVGPVSVGEALLQAEVLRQGKSVTGVQVRIVQNNQVQSVLVASFGNSRTSMVEVPTSRPAPQFKTPEASQLFSFIPGVTPEFLQHFDAVWSQGDLPFSGSSQAEFGGWMKFKAAQNVGQIQLPHLFALIDMWPPAVLPLYDHVAPASSLSWYLDLIHWPDDITGKDWWQYEVKTEYAAHGYAHTQAHIWDAKGRLIALSRQTVTVFI